MRRGSTSARILAAGARSPKRRPPPSALGQKAPPGHRQREAPVLVQLGRGLEHGDGPALELAQVLVRASPHRLEPSHRLPRAAGSSAPSSPGPKTTSASSVRIPKSVVVEEGAASRRGQAQNALPEERTGGLHSCQVEEGGGEVDLGASGGRSCAPPPSRGRDHEQGGDAVAGGGDLGGAYTRAPWSPTMRTRVCLSSPACRARRDSGPAPSRRRPTPVSRMCRGPARRSRARARGRACGCSP
jgi:hypothetical protein